MWANRGVGLTTLTTTAAADPDLFDARLQTLCAHPKFDDAMRHSVRAALAYFQINPLLHRNVKDVGRLILGVVALYLDATGGLTHRRLRTLSGQTGVISAGTATAVLFRMRAIGYVVRDEGGVGGVARRYRPTPEMIETFHDRMKIELDAAAMLMPQIAPITDRLGEPQVFAAVFTALGRESIVAASQPRAELDVLNRLAVRSAGMLVLYDLIAAADDGVSPFGGPCEVEISVSALARKYEISRSHVLSLLRDLEAADFVCRAGRDGLWALRPALSESLRKFFGVIYLGMAFVAAQAAEALGEA